jgi:hypothetical protein
MGLMNYNRSIISRQRVDVLYSFLETFLVVMTNKNTNFMGSTIFSYIKLDNQYGHSLVLYIKLLPWKYGLSVVLYTKQL